MSVGQWLQGRWFDHRHPVIAMGLACLVLLPVHWLFVALSGLRRLGFALGLFKAVRLPVPVAVVGNVTVGGAGKTPLTLWLVAALKARGFQPGIISRGYGGQVQGVAQVLPDADPTLVGDEPLLLARRSGVPVYVGRQRSAAGAALLKDHPRVDVLVCDDGLQHYALARDAEIVIFDGRGAGNGWRLPLGPLREPFSRIARSDALVFNGGAVPGLADKLPAVPAFDMSLEADRFYGLADPKTTCSAADLQGQNCYALAGIGHPQRFFQTLADLGLRTENRAFPDHHAYSAADLDFARDGVLLLTEKDGVKCAPIYDGPAWVLPVAARLPSALAEIIVEKIRGRQAA